MRNNHFRMRSEVLRNPLKRALNAWFHRLSSNQRWGVFYIFEGIVCIILVTNGIGIKLPMPESCYPESYIIGNIQAENLTDNISFIIEAVD